MASSFDHITFYGYGPAGLPTLLAMVSRFSRQPQSNKHISVVVPVQPLGITEELIGLLEHSAGRPVFVLDRSITLVGGGIYIASPEIAGHFRGSRYESYSHRVADSGEVLDGLLISSVTESALAVSVVLLAGNQLASSIGVRAIAEAGGTLVQDQADLIDGAACLYAETLRLSELLRFATGKARPSAVVAATASGGANLSSVECFTESHFHETTRLVGVEQLELWHRHVLSRVVRRFPSSDWIDEIAAKGDADIRVWMPCVGAGYGPWQLLLELERRGRLEEFQIVATDADDFLLSVARRGGPLNRESLAHDSIAPYKSPMRRKLTLALHHLLEDSPPRDVDVVLLPSLLDIFSPAGLDVFLANIVNSLSPGGLLLVNPEESHLLEESALKNSLDDQGGGRYLRLDHSLKLDQRESQAKGLSRRTFDLLKKRNDSNNLAMTVNQSVDINRHQAESVRRLKKEMQALRQENTELKQVVAQVRRVGRQSAGIADWITKESSLIFIVLDQQRRIVELSDSGRKLLSLDVGGVGDELSANHWLTDQGIIQSLESVFVDGQSVDLQFDFLGRTYWLSIRARGPSDEVSEVCIVGHTADVGKPTAPGVQLALDLLGNSEFGVVEIADGRVHGATEIVPKLLGLDRSSLLGATLADCFPASVRESVHVFMRSQQESVVVDLPSTEAAFPQKWLRLVKGQYSAGASVVLLDDVSEQHSLKTQLSQAHKMEVIGQLTSGVAHDFNNILASVLGNVELTLYGVGSDVGFDRERVTQYLRNALESGDRAKKLISQMLLFSHSSQTEQELVDCSEVVEHAVDMLTALLPASLSLVTRCAGSFAGYLDRNKMEQILLNLCINARDASGRTGQVLISVDEQIKSSRRCTSCQSIFEGDYVRIAVSDNGAGIEPELIEKLFNPFFTTKAPGQGTGMGLSVVHGLVHSQDGHVVVESEPLEGATFAVYFPLVRGEVPQNKPDVAVINSEVEMNGSHVLLVDDEESIRDYLKDLLVGHGARVTSCPDAYAALEVIKSGDKMVDLVLTDQIMPRMTGTELADVVCSKKPEIPVVIYTGNPESVETVVASNVVAVLSKPLKADELLNVLHRNRLKSSA